MVSATPIVRPAPRKDWVVYRFDQIAQNVNERVDDPSQAGVDRYVGLEHLDPESLHIRRWGVPTDVEATKLRFRQGDIIFGRRRAYQRKLAVAEFDGICSAHAMVLRAREELVLPEFLPFFLQSDLFFERALAISVGSLSPTINWKTLAREEFALPPKDDQRWLADILWAADRAAENYGRTSPALELAAATILARELSRAPRGTVSDAVVDIVAGKSPAASSEPARGSDLGVLKVSAIGDGRFREEETKALLSKSDFVQELEVKPGFFLVTRANARVSGVGRVCIVETVRHGLMLSDKTLRLVLNPSTIRPRFLLMAMSTSDSRRYIETAAGGTDAKNISQAKLLRVPIPFPSIDVQERIESILRQLDHTKTAVIEHQETLAAIRRRIVDGAIDVQRS